MARLAKLVFPFLILYGCASLQVASEVQSGRKALQREEPKVALSHFETVARLKPDYVTDFTHLNVGIWSYIGRAYYEMGELDRALASLNQARAQNEYDYQGRLYLGLVLVKRGARSEGLKEIEGGLEGLGDFLERLPSRFDDGIYWDLNGQLRASAAKNLEMIKGEDVDSKLLLANVEWLAKKIDEEVDVASDLKRNDFRIIGDGGGKGD